jgi:hypothetical protein
MKILLSTLLLMTAVSVRAAEPAPEPDCRDYDGGLHAEAERLQLLERQGTNQGQTETPDQSGSPVPVEVSSSLPPVEK